MTLDGAALGRDLLGAEVGPREYLVALYPDLHSRIPPLSSVVGTAPPLLAQVNHDIWIAACDCGARGLPSPGCVVFLDTPLGWCARCLNGATGRGWRPVTLPDEPTRLAIGAILACRPNVEDRNWEPPETVEELLRQNVSHGDAVPEVVDVASLALPDEPDWRRAITPFGPHTRNGQARRYTMRGR